MQLELFSDDGKFIKSLSSDSATLSSCDIKDGMRIHVSAVYIMMALAYSLLRSLIVIHLRRKESLKMYHKLRNMK